MTQLLGYITPMCTYTCAGAVYMRGASGRVAEALARRYDKASNWPVLFERMRGAGRIHAGLVSQLLGTGVMALAAFFLLRRFDLMGISFAVLLSACVQQIVLVAAAAKWFGISPLQFWPFGAGNVRLLFQQVAEFRLRDLRSPA